MSGNDMRKAVELRKRAAEDGCLKAQINRASIYFTGMGVDINKPDY